MVKQRIIPVKEVDRWRMPKGEPTAKRKSPLFLDANILKLGRS
jgi:hypothetical protein